MRRQASILRVTEPRQYLHRHADQRQWHQPFGHRRKRLPDRARAAHFESATRHTLQRDVEHRQSQCAGASRQPHRSLPKHSPRTIPPATRTVVFLHRESGSRTSRRGSSAADARSCLSMGVATTAAVEARRRGHPGRIHARHFVRRDRRLVSDIRRDVTGRDSIGLSLGPHADAG